LVRDDFHHFKMFFSLHQFLDPPSAPEAPLIDEIFATTCRIQWSPPKSDGGSPVTNYLVERRLQGATRWSKVTKQTIGSDTTQIISEELLEGSEYEFRVIACNKVGPSEPSAPSRTIVAKNPFGNSYISFSFL
jgi:hypothetical protein